MDTEFWVYLDDLFRKRSIVIDRPRGSFHPRYTNLVYPLDYGYLKGTVTSDGGSIDVWLGTDGGKRSEAIVCTVDLKKMDIELKLLVSCSETDINTIMKFHNSDSMRAILIRRQE